MFVGVVVFVECGFDLFGCCLGGCGEVGGVLCVVMFVEEWDECG